MAPGGVEEFGSSPLKKKLGQLSDFLITNQRAGAPDDVPHEADRTMLVVSLGSLYPELRGLEHMSVASLRLLNNSTEPLWPERSGHPTRAG